MKAIIPAAGLGTRFLPTTKAVPKELLPVVDRPAIQYIVDEAIGAGVSEVVIVNSPAKPSLEEYFSPSAALVDELRQRGKDAYAGVVERAGNLPVSFAYQERALGLGHAIHCAAEFTGDEPFIVSLGDVIVCGPQVLKRMMEVSEQHGGASVIAVVPVPQSEVSRFGVIDGQDVGDGVWKISRMVEKPPADQAPSNLAIFGRYLLSPAVMHGLANAVPGVGGEIQLTDTLDAVLREEEMYALVIDPSEGFDAGTPLSWLETNFALALRDPKLAAPLKESISRMLGGDC